jgi:hypothetical protein
VGTPWKFGGGLWGAALYLTGFLLLAAPGSNEKNENGQHAEDEILF